MSVTPVEVKYRSSLLLPDQLLNDLLGDRLPLEVLVWHRH